MSVRTTADDKKDAAIERLQDTINLCQDTAKLFEDAVNPDTWGADSWNPVFKEKIQVADLELSEIRIRLKKILEQFQK